MKLSDKLRSLRKGAQLSQEQLAEKIGVSRQAITKWETDGGTPDMENLVAIARLFGMSLDELILGEARQQTPDFLFESRTEYDISGSKRFDMELGGAAAVHLSGYEGEKLRARLASSSISDLQGAMKLRLEDEGNRLDLKVRRMRGLTEGQAKEAVHIFLELPRKYMGGMELRAQTERLEIAGFTEAELEFSGRAKRIFISDVSGKIELDVSSDLCVSLEAFSGRLDFNQISATSRIQVPGEWRFRAAVRGMGNRIDYAVDGSRAKDFSDPGAEDVIELNGMRSELLIEKKGR